MDARTVDIQTRIFSAQQLITKFSVQDFENIWDNQDNCNLIESMILRWPIGHFVFYGHDYCINGMSRFNAIKDFIEGKFALTNLKYVETYNGLTFDQLPPWTQRNITEYDIDMKYIVNYCPLDVKYNLIARFK